MPNTRGRVRIINVTDINIKEVSDINDRLPAKDITSEAMFENDSLFKEATDPTYGVGQIDTERLEHLKSKPFNVGEFRNYGYSGGPGDAEIYFNNIVTAPDGVRREFVPTGAELQYMNDHDLIIGIVSLPDVGKAETYIDNGIVYSKNLLDANQSVLLRKGDDWVLNVSDTGVKVGIDYPNGLTGVEPRFKIKITARPGVIDTFVTPSEEENSSSGGFPAWIPIAGMGTTAVVGEFMASESSASALFNWFQGPMNPMRVKLIYNIQRAISDFAGTTLGELLFPIACYVAMIMVADVIWDFAQVPMSVVDGLYQYKYMTAGIYNSEDIRNSYWKLAEGALKQLSGSINHMISDQNNSVEFTAPVDAVIYPAIDHVTEKFINLKFFPAGSQYDLYTPPPVVTYTIELIPISGCKLSETKPTMFTFMIAPDKYAAPVFDVITPSGRATKTVPSIYKNTPVVFENAKYVDFVGLLDRGKPAGLFTAYINYYLNSDGMEGTYKNKLLQMIGNDLVGMGRDIFFSTGVGYPDSSPYDSDFIQEAQAQIIKNPFFRMERTSEVSSDQSFLLKRFWHYGSDWEIRRGAIYRDSAGNQTDGVYQDIPLLIQPINWRQFYWLEISCVVNSGYLLIDTTNTFWNGVYYWTGKWIGEPHKSDRFSIAPPTGMLIDNPNHSLKITESGRYRALLKVDDHNTLDRRFKIKNSEDFTGNINYVGLQYLPQKKLNDGRGAYSAFTYSGQPMLKVKWLNEILSSKRIELAFKVDFSGATVDFYFIPNQDEVSNYNIDIDFGDGVEIRANDTLTPDIDGMYSISHEYASNGVFDATITISMKVGSVTDILLLDKFTCNSPELIFFRDNEALLHRGWLDLSSTKIGYINSQLSSLFRYFMSTDSFNKSYSKLNLNSTPIIGDVSKITSISQMLNISGCVNITGNFDSMNVIPEVYASDCGVVKYGGIIKPVGVDDNKIIEWKSSNGDISEADLNSLIYDLDYSAIEGGMLDISGNNPPITNQFTLDQIASLIAFPHKRWNILYNKGISLTITDGHFELSELSVTNGSGSGLYSAGDEVAVVANSPASGYEFDQWSGDIEILQDIEGESTMAIIPEYNAVIEATYSAMPVVGIKYGALYNWYVVADVRNIAASGWSVPSQADFDAISTYLGGAGVAGGKLKDTDLAYWDSPNVGATNDAGFNARGSSYRLYDGSWGFSFKRGFAIWTINPYLTDFAYTRVINVYSSSFNANNYYINNGAAIRLIKDSTTLTNGQSGVYTGNDGKSYRTICIGTKEILADNLAETKYRNGDLVPEVADNSAWAALTSGAMCAFNNDHSNI